MNQRVRHMVFAIFVVGSLCVGLYLLLIAIPEQQRALEEISQPSTSGPDMALVEDLMGPGEWRIVRRCSRRDVVDKATLYSKMLTNAELKAFVDGAKRALRRWPTLTAQERKAKAVQVRTGIAIRAYELMEAAKDPNGIAGSREALLRVLGEDEDAE